LEIIVVLMTHSPGFYWCSFSNNCSCCWPYYIHQSPMGYVFENFTCYFRCWFIIISL